MSGIVERIKSATTPKEVRNLLTELARYDHASPKTVRRANRAAKANPAMEGEA